VWLAEHLETGKRVAIKQFPKKMDTSSGKVEALILQRIFETEIDPKEFPGIKYIAELLDINEDKSDLWLTYELGGMTLTKNLFDVKGEFYKGERVYHCSYQDLYLALKSNRDVLIDFMTRMLQVFELLAALDIVHADLKPDNILVDFDGEKIKDLKVIDFGSSFIYSEAKSISMSTPEYLSPEVLKYIDKRHSSGLEGAKALFSKMAPWSYDIWSLGAIFLEIITGFPLWLGLKGKITTRKGKNVVNFGIFGVQGRVNAKIVNKQNIVLKDLPSCIKKYDSYGSEKDEFLMDFLYGLLDKSPGKRISPTEALAHPFLTQGS
jgi:dual specificity tyrosine-phosphorylation-regulated kinase 2/3/4